MEQFHKLVTWKSIQEDVEDIEWMPSLKQIEKIIGYRFKNKRLLEQAYTDYSYTKKSMTRSYERLEFLGDATLNYYIARNHFMLYPNLDAGKLTELRSANVSTEKLARAAAHHGLYKFLRHDKPLLGAQVEGFLQALSNYPLSSVGLIDAPKTLANIVESTIAAVYLDSGECIKITSKVIEKLLQPVITPSTIVRSPVTMLSELCQKNGFKKKVVDDSWSETGEIEIIVANEFVGRGQYMMKKAIAHNRAAIDVYNNIVEKLHVNDMKPKI